MTELIPLAEPNLGLQERQWVNDALDSGFVSSVGPFVSRFEAKFAKAVGAKHAIACSSGTAALHLAMRLAHVGPGDPVAVSDFTFIASANAALYQSADLLLVDSDATTWGLDAEALRHEIERLAMGGQRLPKVIELVHVLGQPADIEALVDLCVANGIFLVEDAAESLGARWVGGRYAGRMTGTVGQVGCYSFNGNKIMTTGGGGMIVTADDELAQRARHLATQARVEGFGYLHDDVGYNYRMSNVAAALGLAQLDRLDEFVAAKRRVALRYDDAFSSLPVIKPPRLEGSESTYWLYSILVPGGGEASQRDSLLRHLESAGIQARPLWRPLHTQPTLASARLLGGEVSRSLFEQGLSLPCSTGISDSQIDRVVASVHEFFNRHG